MAFFFTHQSPINISRIPNCLHDVNCDTHLAVFHDSSRARFSSSDLSWNPHEIFDKGITPAVSPCIRKIYSATNDEKREEAREIRESMICSSAHRHTRVGGKRKSQTHTHAHTHTHPHTHTYTHTHRGTNKQRNKQIDENRTEKTRKENHDVANADAIPGKKEFFIARARARWKRKRITKGKSSVLLAKVRKGWTETDGYNLWFVSQRNPFERLRYNGAAVLPAATLILSEYKQVRSSCRWSPAVHYNTFSYNHEEIRQYACIRIYIYLYFIIYRHTRRIVDVRNTCACTMERLAVLSSLSFSRCLCLFLSLYLSISSTIESLIRRNFVELRLPCV